MVASLHNTRILRFLIMLGAVVLTIFVYASYSSNATLSPPHMRSASAPPAPAAALISQQGAKADAASNRSGSAMDTSRSRHGNTISGGGGEGGGAAENVGHKKLIAPVTYVNAVRKQQHHREPTIDEDAGGGGGGAGGGGAGIGGMDDVPDETVLARFVNNDMMEEQYPQNVENTLGNINNTIGSIASAQSQQQQQSEQPIQQKQQLEMQLQQQIQLADNNLNKILDSDVLIPTSNLQKFIENADKILKNMTSGGIAPALGAEIVAAAEAVAPQQQQQKSQSSAPAVAAGAVSAANKIAESKEEARGAPVVSQPKQSQHQAPKVLDSENEVDDYIALPPSVIMTIKHGGGGDAASAADSPASSAANSVQQSNVAPVIAIAKLKTPSTVNTTTPRAPVDPTQGIPTQQIYESGHMNDEINIDKLCPQDGADLKLLILITSAQGHADARMAIRQTWGHYGTRRDVSTAFILGRSTNETLNIALSQENFVYGDLLRGHFIDSYNNLTLKTISALEWVDKHCSLAKYVLKTDDDMFINVPKLLAFLDGHAKEKRVIFGRLAKKWKPIRNKKSKYYVSTGQFASAVFPPFTTGPAYVLSNDIIHELYERSLHQVYLKLEDVFTTGIVSQQLGIKRVHVNEFLNRRIAFNPCNIRKTISVHMIKANEQFDLWKKLLDQTTKCK